MQSNSCEITGWMKHKLASKLQREISKPSDMQMTPPLWQKNRGTKEPLEDERGGWMASGPITWWQMDGGNMETVSDFIFSSFKINVDGDCSHEIKRCLLLGRKTMTNTDSILKSRDITLLIKVCLVEAMVCPVVMYGCESWTIKKTDHPTIDAFELWCWRRLLRVPWTARRSNRLILKEMNPEYSLEYWCWSWSFNTLTTWCEELTP